jgi:hypothetical protein
VSEGGARPTTLGARVAALEARNEALAPLAKLAERLTARGVSADDVSDEQLDLVAGLAKGGGGGILAQLGSGMEALFPGLPFGTKTAPTDHGDE